MKITQLLLLLLFLTAGFMPGQAEAQKGASMDKLRISINGNPVALTPPPLLKDGTWLVPLEAFSKLIGAKVEYPEGSGMAVLCQAERCVPLKLGEQKNGAIKIDGILYASPAAIVEPFGGRMQTALPNSINIVIGGITMAETVNTAGHLALDFVLPDLDGVPRGLSDFRGKKTLLYIWGSW